MYRHLWFLLLVLNPVINAQGKVSSPHLHKSVVFGKGGDTELKMNIAVPSGEGKFPLIILIHGGGWKGGSYEDSGMNTLMKRFAEKGYVGACIQYRLTATGARFPAQVEDCKCAVRFLVAQAGKYQIDTDRIGVFGGSAGGHLALMLGLTTKEDGLEGQGDLLPEYADKPSRVHAVVNLFGPSDLLQGNWEPAVEPLLVDFLGGPVSEKQDLAKKASPLTYLNAERNIPPILTFHGTKDNIVPYIHATKLHDALAKTKAEHKLITMEGDGHGWPGAKAEETFQATLKFFDQHLKTKP
ncbi:MAG TPA: alpha/beta hydrolase [Gemmatales bacterium]|nr:alpha/beta hydrolase [Gemmatales bacterium]